MDLSSGTMATGGVANVGATSFATGGCDGPAAGALGAGGAAFGAAGDTGCVAAGADGAIGFWALMADAKNATVAPAISKMSLDMRGRRERQNRPDLQDETFKRAFVAACIDYMSRKLRIIWWPPSVSTLSGWNC